MSQISDIKKGFLKLQKENNWTNNETAKNMKNILNCIEWQFFTDNEKPNSEGIILYDVLSKMEFDECYKILYS